MTTLPTLAAGDAWLPISAAASLSGVPDSAVREMAKDGQIPAQNIGTGSHDVFRFQLSQSQQIKEAYDKRQALGALRRAESARQRGGRIEDLERRIEHIEQQLGLGSNAERSANGVY